MSYEIPQVNLGEYQTISVLGQGAYGRVSLVKNTSTGKEYAAKETFKNYDKDDQKHDFNKEMLTYSKAKSPALLKIIGYSLTNFQNQDFPIIITELMAKSSLDKYFNSECKEYLKLTPPQKYIILLGIAIGMKVLHSKSIIHRDLKPGNVLLDDNFYPHIADFGVSFISNIQSSQIIMNTLTGTPLYQAPEILTDEPYTSKVDVYSYSLIAYQLLTNKLPFTGYKSSFKMQSDIVKGMRPDTSSISDQFIIDFLQSSWSENPTKRPNFEEVFDTILDERFQNFFGITEEDVDNYLDFFDERIKLKRSTTKFLYTLKKKAAEGDAESMFQLGVIYDQGEKDTKIDQQKAVEYYKQACANGNSDAMLILGHKLLKGDGIPQNKPEAALLYKKFADEYENMKAMNNYGLMRLYGNGIESNKDEASHYLKKSADLGNPKAMLAYAKMLYDKDNKKEALKYYRLSADQGNETAMCNYAAMCRKGDGVVKNPKEAVKYFRMFASRGNCIAMFNLGMMLLMGNEIHRDKKEAATLMKAAAELDDPDAMFIYGVMLFEGDGIETDKDEALMYLEMSADRGNENAEKFLRKNFRK